MTTRNMKHFHNFSIIEILRFIDRYAMLNEKEHLLEYVRDRFVLSQNENWSEATWEAAEDFCIHALTTATDALDKSHKYWNEYNEGKYPWEDK